MDLMLTNLQWSSCLVYLDDIIIVGRTFLEHLQNLESVFQRLQKAGLKLKPRKFAFFRKEVSYLGHLVSHEEIATDPAKTTKVSHWPLPTTTKEVQKFLGLASYYRRFIRDFAAVAKPLHSLTEHKTLFQWTAECQHAFEELRCRLTTAPVLAYPDYTKPFVLDTDASDVGIGAVLAQCDEDGHERVVAFASRTLSKAERRYCVIRRELLAVVVFTQHFRPYLLGLEFVLHTDHGSLTWLQSFKELEGQIARWLQKFQEFNFSIVHRKEKNHQNADALSRLPCKQCGREEEQNIIQISMASREESDNIPEQEALPVMRELQEGDPLYLYCTQIKRS